MTPPHPKTLDINDLQQKVELEPKVFGELLQQMKSWSSEGLPDQPDKTPESLPAGPQRIALERAIQNLAFGESSKLANDALLWNATGSWLALEDARRRADNLANWAPHGTTGFYSHDQAGLSITFSLALAYDWLYPQLSEPERDQITAAVAERLKDILGNGPFGLHDGHKLDSFPFDSHGAVAMARTAVICTIMADKGPLFAQCARDIVPRYLARPVPWGGDDGGYANGTAYAQWDMLSTHLVVWPLLKQALGTDLSGLPWAKGYGDYLTYFLPPGTPAGLFGDGAEGDWKRIWATQARTYDALIPSPLLDWYASQQPDFNPAELAFLLAPYRDLSKVPDLLPTDTPNGKLIPSIGWVAMHSNLADRERTSVYFKSSPYGSFNHSHADQNSFVINAKGQRLAIASGYYDYYGSPHWKNWYKQTRASNAITFDDGQGQLVDTMAAKGKIIEFKTTPDYDIATGDATLAYGGELTQAVRSMVYVHPNTLLVFDSLASDKPRTWEWNIHALDTIKTENGHAIEIDRGKARLCVNILSGPPMHFSQTNQFTVPPGGNYPLQWHGRFSSSTKSTEMQMLTLLDVGCTGSLPKVRQDGRSLHVSMNGRLFGFASDGKVTVQ